ncbi:hypothetical protein [Actinoplanes sp. M2I2]|uniref:hypothetical protein n=1 Tax=Actinoplanes sp. M2I2 TaxID=1734444 RepID=UPI0020221786|nr:hypothetical protein [Actinoplanes sp. M2I2]
MGDSVQPVGEVRILAQTRLWPAIAIPGVAAIAIVIGALATGYVSWYAVGGVAASFSIAVARRHNTVLSDDKGLLLRAGRALSRSYAWSDIERMGWRDTGLWGSTLQVHPRGGPYDVPGPNSPIDVGKVWRPRRRYADDPMPALLQHHGIKTLVDR